MQPKHWGALYFLILLADLCVIAFDIPYARFATKPLIMILLGFYGWSQAGCLPHRSKNFILAAIIFSWSGDVFLLFPHYFIAGLVSFLTAHLLYTGFFLTVQPKPKPGWKEGAVLVVIIIYAVRLVQRLVANLGDMKPAVIVYTAVISLMFLSAVRAFGLNSSKAGRLCIGGALLFVLSDSILAIEKFLTPFPGSGILVMLTYGIAQWMIVDGSLRHLKTAK
ncbi:lysoplasmalogenase [Chitinophaga barathri]|nr:lysoplasmalogenase [Chitinophaga barathri]